MGFNLKEHNLLQLKKKEKNLKKYPLLTLKKSVIFPVERSSLVLQDESVKKILSKGVRDLVLAFQDDNKRSEVGVVAKILHFWYIDSLTVALMVEGVRRVRIVRETSEDNITQAEVQMVEEEHVMTANLEALSRSVFDQMKKLMYLKEMVPAALINELQKDTLSPSKTSDIVASVLPLDIRNKMTLIETVDSKKRLKILQDKLMQELNVVEEEKKIQQAVDEKVNKQQREYILRERLKAIEHELGIGQERQDYEEIEKKILKAKMPKNIEAKARRELQRLRTMPALSAEVPYIRSYLDWLADLPWTTKKRARIELKGAQEVLDRDHYGLEKVKERVLEYLAVQKLTKGKSYGNIMCFVGPPGTGKTSVGKSIAKSLGRNFVRISLGGIRDEAEIRGHRRTYVGALPGRIIQGMRTAGTKNPVFMMDEIDKLGADFRGDPSAALLEVLDPEQNREFSDHYLEVPFDLSQVFFITTANILDPIPSALRDRLEIIEFTGYTDEEKFEIARRFLMPRVLSKHGLKENQFAVEDNAIRCIIHSYTREAGIRNMERKLSQIARKVAKRIAERGLKEKIFIKENALKEYLGPEEYKLEMREEKDEVGVATGLAWMPSGGSIIFVEANLVPGKGNLTLTGQLGKVMQESAKAAWSYIRSRADDLKFDPAFYEKSDIHVHVPSGSIPKDGPSAGTAIAAALASVLTKRKVKKEVALTGEISLSGKVLEIGGVKEKVLAAHRAGVETVILPRDNKKNLVDIPKEVRGKLKFKFVRHMDKVLDEVLI